MNNERRFCISNPFLDRYVNSCMALRYCNRLNFLHCQKNDEKVNEIWGDIDMIRADVSSNKSFLEGKLTDMIKEFQVGVDTLKSAVSEMREYISVVKTEHSEKIKSIEKDLQDQKCWLEADDKELSEHAIKIAEIKTMCESQHNRRK